MSKKKVIAQDRTLSIGMDVDSQKSQIVIMDYEYGEIHYEGKILHNEEHWHHLLERLVNCKIWACYEAGCIGFKLCRFLRSIGVDCQVVAPSKVPYSAENRKRKTDRRDALTIAKMFFDQPKAFVRIPTVEEEVDRQLIRTREQFIKDQKRIKQRIKSFLCYYQIRKPSDIGKCWEKKHIEWLRTYIFHHSAQRDCLDLLLDELEFTGKQIARLDRKIEELSKSEKYAAKCEKLCRQLDGVGILTAMTFLTEIFRPEDFKTPAALSSHIGLTPSEYSSGGRRRLGKITHWGPPHLRRILTEASWTWIRFDENARKRFWAIRAGKEPKKAIIAMARRLAIIMWAMIVKDEDYNYRWAA